MKLLRPAMPMLRSGMRMVDHHEEGQPPARLRGGALMDMRRRLWARSGQRCECDECQAGIPLKLTWHTFEADHIVPVFEGGTNHITNMRALHIDCHKRITAEQAPRMQGRTWADRAKVD